MTRSIAEKSFWGGLGMALVCGGLALAGAAHLGAGAAGLLSYQVVMTGAELQARVDAMRPIKVEKFKATLALPAPKVELFEASDQMTVSSPIEVSMPGLGGEAPRVTGFAKIKGFLRYEASEGAFYVDHPQVVDFEVRGLPEKHKDRARDLAQLAASKALGARPVYVLRDESVKQKLARAVLKSVVVRNGKLVATLGL